MDTVFTSFYNFIIHKGKGVAFLLVFFAFFVLNISAQTYTYNYNCSTATGELKASDILAGAKDDNGNHIPDGSGLSDDDQTGGVWTEKSTLTFSKEEDEEEEDAIITDITNGTHKLEWDDKDFFNHQVYEIELIVSDAPSVSGFSSNNGPVFCGSDDPVLNLTISGSPNYTVIIKDDSGNEVYNENDYSGTGTIGLSTNPNYYLFFNLS